jgi:hypothetical protein
MIRENVDSPAPGGDEATKPVSERAEGAIETLLFSMEMSFSNTLSPI